MNASERQQRMAEAVSFVASLRTHLPDGELDDVDADDPTGLALGFTADGRSCVLDAPGRAYSAHAGVAFRVERDDEGGPRNCHGLS